MDAFLIGSADTVCEWILTFNTTGCAEDCEGLVAVELDNIIENCTNCLSNELLDCEDVPICSSITDFEACENLSCSWNDSQGCYEPNGEDEDGPPECLEDCVGIENINPEENPYAACDWILSNFGPNNFFNECANDCDDETIMIIDQIAEACFSCMSDENIDCAQVWDDEGDDGGVGHSCSDLTQDECDSIDDCEWIADPLNDFYGCVEIEPGGDDGGTGGGDGCFEGGEWYCYGCELFINECEYYECTESGWTGPFAIDDCWDNCYEITNESECTNNPDCMWISGVAGWTCIDANDNPPADSAILKLEHKTGLPGSAVSVPLILSNTEIVGGLQFSISGYQNTFAMGVDSFESIDNCFSASYNELDQELVGIIFSLEGCVYGPQDYNHIANIIFFIDDEVPVGSSIPLSFNYTLVSDPAGNAMSSNGQGSHITIGMQGDINNDGEINVLDIVMVVNFSISAQAPTGSEFWASDINFDGFINILDVVQIINIILQN